MVGEVAAGGEERDEGEEPEGEAEADMVVVGRVSVVGRDWYSRRDCSWWDEAENSHQDRKLSVDMMLSTLPQSEATVTSTEKSDVE